MKQERYHVMTNGKTKIILSETTIAANAERHSEMGFKKDNSNAACIMLLNKGLAHTDDYEQLSSAGVLSNASEVKSDPIEEVIAKIDRTDPPLDTDAPKTMTPSDTIEVEVKKRKTKKK